MSTKRAAAFIIVSILIIAAFAGFDLSNNNSQNPQSVYNGKISQDTTSVTNEAEITTAGETQLRPKVITSDIDTSDWKTYRNEEFGLEFKYPDEWRLLVFVKGEFIADPSASGGQGRFERNESPLLIEVKGETKSDFKFFYTIDETNFNLLEKLYSDDPEAWVVAPIAVNHRKTKMYTRTNNVFQIRIPFQIGKYRHELSWRQEGGTKEKNQQLLNAFLLDLRFFEQKG